MTLIRHKDGHPNVKFFESIETLNQFDTIRKALQKKDLKKIFGDDQGHLTKDHIAQLVLQLLHFQEDHLGRQANGSAPLMRIPVRRISSHSSIDHSSFSRWNVFSIFANQVHSITSFLAVMNIKTTIIGKREKKRSNCLMYFHFNRKKLDLSAHSRNEVIKLFQYIQKLLIDRNVLTLPICYLRPDIDKRLQSQLKQIIEKNNGTVADKEEDADHIVYPPITENPREIENERESND